MELLEFTPLIIFLIVIAAIIGLLIYFLPTIIASKNNHPDTLWIFLVNLIFGSTLIGWVAALIWAVKTDLQVSRLF